MGFYRPLPLQFISSMPPGQSETKSQKREIGKQPKNGESSPSPGHMEGTDPSSHEKVAFTIEIMELASYRKRYLM